jgi:hypothetical protein
MLECRYCRKMPHKTNMPYNLQNICNVLVTGALIVKNSSSHVLKRSFFGGGTVEMLLSRENFHVSRRVLNERYIDLTVNDAVVFQLPAKTVKMSL